jgi:arginyl-tRNA synthetase
MLPLFEEEIRALIAKAVREKFELELDQGKLKVGAPPESFMGDAAVPVGFLLSKILKRNPFEIVQELAGVIEKFPEIEKAEPAKPGFLNLYLSLSFFQEKIEVLIKDPEALNFSPKNEKVLLEYVSANPTGPLHIGHGRWAALGDSIARLMKKAGYEVHKEFYVNDAGVQINNLKRTIEALKSNDEVPEDGYRGEYVKEALESKLEPHEYFLERQKTTLENFGAEFDNFYSETKLHQSGEIEKALELLREKGYLYEEEGATWFRSTEFGDDKDRVLIKNDGKYTYFAPDIAYHLTKIERGANRLVDILGADHHGYVKRITAAVMALSGKKVKFDVIIGQLVNLFRAGEPVRMSKRTGDIITLEEVMDEIGRDALRYILVSKKHSQALDFDLEEVRRQTKDNPVFYIQYAFARINSIFKKIEDIPDISVLKLEKIEESERNLLNKIVRFKDEIYSAAMEEEPHRMATYLLDLAGLFHKFYEQNRVIDYGALIPYRYFIIQAAARVLREGLSLLGIRSPEKM